MKVLVVPLSALSLSCLAYAAWMLDQNFAVRFCRPFHVVYLLLNRAGEPLYIGSTDDLERRYDEHTADRHQAADPWRRAIAGVTVLRFCRSETQARRVERRMIRAYTAFSVRGDWTCPRLNNDHWADPPPAYAKPWRRLWSTVYRVLGRLHPELCWDRPNPTPPRPETRPLDDGPPEAGYDPLGRTVIDVDVIDDASSAVTTEPTAPVGGFTPDDDADDALDDPDEDTSPPFEARALPAASSQTALRASVSASDPQEARAARKARQAEASRRYRARRRGVSQ